MTVKEFVNEYNNAEDKHDYIDSHQTVKYIAYLDKVSDCKRIIESTHFLADESGNEFFMQNSVYADMLYTLVIIDNYYDFDIDFLNVTDSYDLLASNNLITKLKHAIPSCEFDEYNKIYQLVECDFNENERSLISYIDKKLDQLNIVINSYLESQANNTN